MQERLRVAERGRQPGGLLHLERQLAAGRQVGAGRHDDHLAAPGELGGDPFRVRGLLQARGEERPDRDRVRVAALAGKRGPHRDAGQDRGEVADRVAPAPVDLRGFEDQRAQRADRCGTADGDGRDLRAAGRGGAQRSQGRGGAALMADPDDQPAALGRQRCLERLAGQDAPRLAGALEAGTFRRVGDDRGERHRAVLAGAASRDHDRVAGLQRGADRRREAAGRRVAAGRLQLRRNARHARAAPHHAEAPEHAAGKRGLGGDHLGHPPGRPVTVRGGGQEVPRRGRAGEDRLRIRVGEDGRVERRRQLHAADDRLAGGDVGLTLARGRAGRIATRAVAAEGCGHTWMSG